MRLSDGARASDRAVRPYHVAKRPKRSEIANHGGATAHVAAKRQVVRGWAGHTGLVISIARGRRSGNAVGLWTRRDVSAILEPCVWNAASRHFDGQGQRLPG